MKKIITSESVNIGHPDKTCDVIADSFLDEALKQDPNAQMAVECAIKDDKLFIYGEATTSAAIDYERVAKDVLKEIGYQNEFEVIKQISKQSPDINHAVEQAEVRANDQGMTYGYACNETDEFMHNASTADVELAKMKLRQLGYAVVEYKLGTWGIAW